MSQHVSAWTVVIQCVKIVLVKLPHFIRCRNNSPSPPNCMIQFRILTQDFLLMRSDNKASRLVQQRAGRAQSVH
jgi:hypothetical protein